MVCRFIVVELERACIVRGKVIEPPPPPPPLVEPPQDTRPAATAASSINASGRAKAAVLWLRPLRPPRRDTRIEAPVPRFDAMSVARNIAAAIAHIHAVIISEGLDGESGTPGQRCTADAEGFAETLTFSIALPGTMTEGELQLTPAGAPPQVKVTGPVKPFVELRETVKPAEPPTLIVADVGLTDAVNRDTTNTVDTNCVVPPPVPTTLTEYVPAAIVAGRLTVSVEVATDVEGVTVAGLKEHTAPAGGFEQLSVTL
jgi:hypothetical protein